MLVRGIEGTGGRGSGPKRKGSKEYEYCILVHQFSARERLSSREAGLARPEILGCGR